MQGNRFDIQADTQNENKTQLVPQALHRNNYYFYIPDTNEDIL